METSRLSIGKMKVKYKRFDKGEGIVEQVKNIQVLGAINDFTVF